jgi:hypothetical protein
MPLSPWTRDEAGHNRAVIGAYYLDGAYGGYNLACMVNDGGGIQHPIGHGYRSKRECRDLICAYINGLEEDRRAVRAYG